MPTVCNNESDEVDIEDIVGEGDLAGLERSMGRSNAVIKRIKKAGPTQKKGTTNGHSEVNSLETINEASTIPGTQKIWVKTWGCAHNNSDSEYMAGQLASYGYTITGLIIKILFNFKID